MLRLAGRRFFHLRRKAVLKGLAIVVFCVALLAALDQALNDGFYSEPAREMLRQIAHSFGF
jgi:hypothetical protein